MAKELSDTTYRSLRDEISAIYTESKQQGALDIILDIFPILFYYLYNSIILQYG